MVADTSGMAPGTIYPYSGTLPRQIITLCVRYMPGLLYVITIKLMKE